MIDYIKLWEQEAGKRQALCELFYEGPYREAFPDLNQTESPEVWLPLMGEAAPLGKQQVWIVLACDGTAVLGGIVFEKYRGCGDWLVTYIAVRAASRGQGLANGLISQAKLAIDTASVGSATYNVYAEAENPHLKGTLDARAAGYQRWQILSEFGLRRLDFTYIQPALGEGKEPLEDLILMVWAPAFGAEAKSIAALRLLQFLTEFYATLDAPADSLELAKITAELRGVAEIEIKALEIPARYDLTLGKAEAVTVRMTFLSRHLHDLTTATPLPDEATHKNKREKNAAHYHEVTTTGEIPLELIDETYNRHDINDPQNPYHLLAHSTRSFHRDITIPFAASGGIPMIVPCEAFNADSDRADKEVEPPSVLIEFPNLFKMDWEGEEVPYRFDDPDAGSYVVAARLVDSIVFYESGYIAYSAAFVFQNAVKPQVTVNTYQILALALAAGSAGTVSGRPLRFSFPGDDLEDFKTLNAFFHHRLLALLKRPEADHTVFSVLRKSKIRKLGEDLINDITQMTFLDHQKNSPKVNTKASIAVEVVGAEKQMEIIRVVQGALTRAEKIDGFSLRLAGLSQNVLDFERQDASEVYDSLAAGFVFGSDVHFAHTSMSVRFSTSSRSFNDKWPVIGGEPYWFLVELIVAHNAKLLIDLNEDIREFQSRSGLSGRFQHILNLEDNEIEGAARRKDLEKRNSRRIRLAHYVPNIFRYPIEKLLYEKFTDARGLTLQFKNFFDFDDTVERITRDAELHRKSQAEALRSEDSRRQQMLLFIIGVVQTVGVFATFASVFIAIAALSDSDFGSFVRNVHLALGHPDLMPMIKEIDAGSPPPYAPLPIWALLPALGIIFAGISFLLFFAVVFSERQPGESRWMGARLAIRCVVGLLLWSAVEVAALPLLAGGIFIAAIAGFAPVFAACWWHNKSVLRLVLRSFGLGFLKPEHDTIEGGS